MSTDVMLNEGLIEIEIVYPLPNEQKVLNLKVTQGTSAKQAIMQSGLLQRYPEIDLEAQAIGIYSQLLKEDEVLKSGDRVEIYRPLLADPKEVRKRRAEETKAAKEAKEAQNKQEALNKNHAQ